MPSNTDPEFNASAYVLTVARRQAMRLGFPSTRLLGEMPDRGFCFIAGHVEWPVQRQLMASEPWIIARMALDLRAAIVAMAVEADELAHSFDTSDLIEMGWSRDHVRRFAAVALACAMADVASGKHLAHQRQFSGFSTTLSWFVVALLACGLGLAGGIGMIATALATP